MRVMERNHVATEPRLKILHLIASLGETNTEYNEHCLPMVEQRDVTVCSFSPAAVAVPPSIRVFAGDGTYRGFFHALDTALEDGRYDVIHAHAPRTAFLLLASNLLHRRSMAGSVYTLHNSFSNLRPLGRALLFPILAAFPAIVVCGRSAAQSLPSLLRRIAGSRLAVVQNGVDTDRVHAATDRASRHSSRVGLRVVWVGRLLPRKDPLCSISAVEAVSADACTLTIVGGGDLEGRLRDEIKERGLGARVFVTGLVERDKVYREMLDADVFVATSRGEGLPVAVLEAMAVGLPVVLSDIPPHREIAEGVDFIPLFPVGDTRALTAELRRFMEMVPTERTARGDRCRELVERRFGLNSMHRAYEDVYSNVTDPSFRRARPGPVKEEVK